MYRYKIIVEYVGTNFYGWQIQPAKRTVQGEITKVLNKYFKLKKYPNGSGRTDTGVHSEYQAVNFELPVYILPSKLKSILNNSLPYDIGVKNVKTVPQDFDARRDAVSRTYQYRIKCGNYISPFIKDRYYIRKDKLDIKKLNRISKVFIGKHNFKAFSVTGTYHKTTVRTVVKSRWNFKDNMYIYTITADAFLRKMVRMIVSSILDVYDEKISIDDLIIMIEKAERIVNITPADPCGLYLTKVKYLYEKV